MRYETIILINYVFSCSLRVNIYSLVMPDFYWLCQIYQRVQEAPRDICLIFVLLQLLFNFSRWNKTLISDVDFSPYLFLIHRLRQLSLFFSCIWNYLYEYHIFPVYIPIFILLIIGTQNQFEYIPKLLKIQNLKWMQNILMLLPLVYSILDTCAYIDVFFKRCCFL